MMEITNNIKKVAASMAIEEMDLSPEFIRELMQIEESKKTTEELRQEVLNKVKGKDLN